MASGKSGKTIYSSYMVPQYPMQNVEKYEFNSDFCVCFFFRWQYAIMAEYDEDIEW